MDQTHFAPAQAEAPAWHALSTAEAFDHLATDSSGLSNEEAQRRLEVHGPNSASRASPPIGADTLSAAVP